MSARSSSAGAVCTRIVAWLLCVLLVSDALAILWVVRESMRPEPGANMKLMIVPMLAGAALPFAAALLAIMFTFGRHLLQWETITFRVAAGFWLVPGLAAWLLG